MQKTYLYLASLLLFMTNIILAQAPINSIETGYTISNVRTATDTNGEYIVANSYEGTLMGIGYDENIRWTNALSGFMNHDVWCEDITGDGVDEVLAANADGNIYCLNNNGDLLWQFMQDEVPMYSVCVVRDNGTPYVVASSLDLSIYYLSASGSLVKEIDSATYSEENTWGDDAPPSGTHLANFVRKIKNADGTEDLIVHGCVNTNSTSGSLYFFHAFADLPHIITEPQNVKPIGDVRVSNYFGDGQEKIITGSSTNHHTMDVSIYTQNTATAAYAKLSDYKNELGGFGYRVVQADIIPTGNSYEYFTLIGPTLALISADLDLENMEILSCNYAFNDMWHDSVNNNMILASAQSGGSAIHLIDYTNPAWKDAYQNINPPGNIQKILNNTQAVRDQLNNFTAPDWECSPRKVYFVSDLSTNLNSNTPYVTDLAADIHANYDSPVLLGSHFMSNCQDPIDWNRDTMSNAFYRDTRDSRKDYVLTQSQVLADILPEYSNFPGLSYWGGHGNDPYFYSLETKKALLDDAHSNDKKTVLIYPELQNDSPDFLYVVNDLIYPLATYARTRNTQIHLRTKHIFWQGAAYGPNWRRMLSGEFADVFVPTMEQTGDKSMDLSIAARVGYWMSGAVNEWGDRAVPDNASYYRLRQHSNQQLPNHHLREVIYAAANGASHFNNLRVDVEYTSLVWELIAKGALFVPERNEIVSFSPVHLSMTHDPDPYYLNEGANVKWVNAYNQAAEENNKLVFSRLNGSWPGAPVTDWDFSNYAAKEKERRLNHIPAYNEGLVLITPPQAGHFALDNEPRGKLTDHLHPMYENIMKEYVTDGRNYYALNNSQTHPAETYFATVKNKIRQRKTQLPLTVDGDVGWVVAQTAENHLRLTVVDGAWLNPSDKVATVAFHTATPVAMTDILTGESFDLTDLDAVAVDVPCGLFRFIDIELGSPLALDTETDTIPVIEEADIINLLVFPNPTADILTIQFFSKTKNTTLQIVDNEGKVLRQKTMATERGEVNELRWDVADLGVGVYYLQLVGGALVERFVVGR